MGWVISVWKKKVKITGIWRMGNDWFREIKTLAFEEAFTRESLTLSYCSWEKKTFRNGKRVILGYKGLSLQYSRWKPVSTFVTLVVSCRLAQLRLLERVFAWKISHPSQGCVYDFHLCQGWNVTCRLLQKRYDISTPSWSNLILIKIKHSR